MPWLITHLLLQPADIPEFVCPRIPQGFRLDPVNVCYDCLFAIIANRQRSNTAKMDQCIIIDLNPLWLLLYSLFPLVVGISMFRIFQMHSGNH